jgi:hypothetical protein
LDLHILTELRAEPTKPRYQDLREVDGTADAIPPGEKSNRRGCPCQEF